MAHFLKINDCGGVELHINLDMITEVNVDEREVTLSTGDAYSFDDDLNDAEWRLVIDFIKLNMF